MAARGPFQAGILVVRVVVVAQLDPVDGVHHVGYCTHADLHEVIDGETRQLLHGLHEQLRAAVCVGGVDLVPADARDLRVGVTRNRQGDLLPVRGDVDEHDRVGALGFVEAVLDGAVGARVGTRQQVSRARSVGGPREGAHASHVRVGVPHEESAPREDEDQEQAQGLENRMAALASPRLCNRGRGSDWYGGRRGRALGAIDRHLTRPVARRRVRA